MKYLITAFLLATLGFAKDIVTTSILPTAYFVKQIAGNTLDVQTMIQKGVDPHTYEPRPSQMKNLENSTMYFAVGIDFENSWLPKFKKLFPNLVVVNTQDTIKKIAMVEHEHEGEHHHHHENELDPHVWLDPILVKIQARNIANALIKRYPQNKDLYEANLAKFDKKLDELNNFANNSFKNIKNRDFIVYHPSWGYFAKRYDLTQIPIEINGKEPKPKELKELIDEAKEHNVKVIFVAPQFPKKAAITIANECGAKVEEIDQLPLNWDKEMRKSIIAIKQSL